MRFQSKLAVLFVLLLALALASSLHATCTTYSNSSPDDFGLNGSGAACMGTGPGCIECIDYNQNGSGKSCVRDWWGFVEYCYYWGQDFQQL